VGMFGLPSLASLLGMGTQRNQRQQRQQGQLRHRKEEREELLASAYGVPLAEWMALADSERGRILNRASQCQCRQAKPQAKPRRGQLETSLSNLCLLGAQEAAKEQREVQLAMKLGWTPAAWNELSTQERAQIRYRAKKRGRDMEDEEEQQQGGRTRRRSSREGAAAAGGGGGTWRTRRSSSREGAAAAGGSSRKQQSKESRKMDKMGWCVFEMCFKEAEKAGSEIGSLDAFGEIAGVLVEDNCSNFEEIFQTHIVGANGEVMGTSIGDMKRLQKTFECAADDGQEGQRTQRTRGGRHRAKAAGAAGAVLSLIHALAVILFDYENNFITRKYKAWRRLHLLRCLEGCNRQSGHTDVTERCYSNACFAKVPHFSIIIPVSKDGAELWVWPQSHLLVQREGELAYREGDDAYCPGTDAYRAAVDRLKSTLPQGSIGAVKVVVPYGSAIAFRGDLVHAGQANTSKEINDRLHCFCIPEDCRLGENTASLLPKSVADLCTDSLRIEP